MAGKRGKDAMTNGDPSLMSGASEAGHGAVNREIQSETKRELRGGYKKGGKVSSASSRADGIAQRGKTRGRTV